MNEISLDTYRTMSEAAAWFRATDKTLKASKQILKAEFLDMSEVVLLKLRKKDSSLDNDCESNHRVRMNLHKAIREDAEKYSFPSEVMEEIVNPFIQRATEKLMRTRKLLNLKTCDKIIGEYDSVLQHAKEVTNGNVSGLHVQGGKGKNLSPKVNSGSSSSKSKVNSGNSSSKHSDFLNTLNSNVKDAKELPKKAKKIVKSVSSKIEEKASKIGQKFSPNMLTGAFKGKSSSGK